MLNKIGSASLYAIPGIPVIKKGVDLGQLVSEAAQSADFQLKDADVVVVAHKVVSKAEGSVAILSETVPSEMAMELSQATGRDPRLCQIIIQESAEILSTKGRMIITKHRLGFTCTNAGVDSSNVAPRDEGIVVLLPSDPDASCQRIRLAIRKHTGVDVAVILSDSFGKADRQGAIGTAIGLAGISAVENRDQRDICGNPAHSVIALVDELAAAASMLMGQADEMCPVVVIRGIPFTASENASIKDLLIT